jgi:hypothetical protein
MADMKSGATEKGSVSGQSNGSGFLKKNEKKADFAKGGTTPMFGEQGAEPQKEGVTWHSTGDDQGPSDENGNGPVVGDKFAKGGTTKMFGYEGSQPARGGITSAR